MKAGSIINPWLGHIAPIRPNKRSAIRPAVIRMKRILSSDGAHACCCGTFLFLVLCILQFWLPVIEMWMRAI